MSKIVFLALLASGLLRQLSAESEEITPCDLMKTKPPSATLSIRGTMQFDMHGMYVYSRRCGQKTPAIVVSFPHSDSAPEVQFDVAKETPEKLRPFLRLTGGSSVACGVLTGQLFEKAGFHLKQSGGGPHGNGYGPRGAFRWILVLQSVQSIHPCEPE